MISFGLVAVFFVAAGLVAAGAFAAAWRRDLTAAVAGIPLMFAGAGVAFAGISRLAAGGGVVGHQELGQGFSVVLAIAALALVALGIGIAGREATR